MSNPPSDPSTKTGLSPAMEARLLEAIQKSLNENLLGKRITRKRAQ